MEKEKKSLNGLIMVVGLALLIGLAGAGGWLLGEKFASMEDKASQSEQTQVPESNKAGENVDLGKIVLQNKISGFEWLLWEFFDKYGTKTELDFAGKDIFGNVKDGGELLDTQEKKVKMALIYVNMEVDSIYDIILENEEIDDQLGVAGGTGGRAVPIESLKNAYKTLFGEELPDKKSCDENNLQWGKNDCVYKDYYFYSEWSGTSERIYFKLKFNSLTKTDNQSRLIFDIDTIKGTYDNFHYENSGSQLIIKSVINKDKYDNESYQIKSMTYKK